MAHTAKSVIQRLLGRAEYAPLIEATVNDEVMVTDLVYIPKPNAEPVLGVVVGPGPEVPEADRKHRRGLRIILRDGYLVTAVLRYERNRYNGQRRAAWDDFSIFSPSRALLSTDLAKEYVLGDLSDQMSLIDLALK